MLYNTYSICSVMIQILSTALERVCLLMLTNKSGCFVWKWWGWERSQVIPFISVVILTSFTPRPMELSQLFKFSLHLSHFCVILTFPHCIFWQGLFNILKYINRLQTPFMVVLAKKLTKRIATYKITLFLLYSKFQLWICASVHPEIKVINNSLPHTAQPYYPTGLSSRNSNLRPP